jgi:hypothetical protein
VPPISERLKGRRGFCDKSGQALLSLCDPDVFQTAGLPGFVRTESYLVRTAHPTGWRLAFSGRLAGFFVAGIKFRTHPLAAFAAQTTSCLGHPGWKNEVKNRLPRRLLLLAMTGGVEQIAPSSPRLWRASRQGGDCTGRDGEGFVISLGRPSCRFATRTFFKRPGYPFLRKESYLVRKGTPYRVAMCGGGGACGLSWG